ncbi:hypothetical protein GGR53DRAFT_85380 [Hypoxylon sp. FL1150]|nr:hypothetical protein GGR53DRAFT_85380 [Hypoxylon sp. FL1150]
MRRNYPFWGAAGSLITIYKNCPVSPLDEISVLCLSNPHAGYMGEADWGDYLIISCSLYRRLTRSLADRHTDIATLQGEVSSWFGSYWPPCSRSSLNHTTLSTPLFLLMSLVQYIFTQLFSSLAYAMLYIMYIRSLAFATHAQRPIVPGLFSASPSAPWQNRTSRFGPNAA